MKKYLKSTEVVSVLRCSLETLRDWRRKESLVGVKSGRQYRFEIKSLLDWLRQSQKHDYADLLYDYIAGTKPKPKAKSKIKPQAKPKAKTKPKTKKATKPKTKSKAKTKPGTKKSKKTPKPKTAKAVKNSEMTKQEIYTNAVDLFGQRFILGKTFATRAIMLQAEKDPINAARISSLLTQLSETFRKNELACLEIDQRCGGVAAMQDVISFIGKMSTSIKTEALAIPAALSEELAAETDPKEVYKILDDAIRSSLNHLSKEFNK